MAIPGPDPKMLDDLARMAGGAVNIFSGFQDQIRNDIRARVEELASRLDLVPRDELDQAKAMIEKLRREIQALDARVAALESPAAKPARKKTAAANQSAGKAKAKPAASGRAKPKPKVKSAGKKR